MRKRPLPKAEPQSPTAKFDNSRENAAEAHRRLRTPTLKSAVQQAAHELLDQLGVARSAQLLRNSIDKQEVRRLQRLSQLLDKLRTTRQRNQQLKRVLTASEYATFIQQVAAPMNSGEMLTGEKLPDVLKQYQKLLQRADRVNALATGTATRKRKSGKGAAEARLHNGAEVLYEKACEYLNEQIAVADPAKQEQINAFLDRDFDYGHGGAISPDAAGVARVKGSRSTYCKANVRKTRAEKLQRLHEIQIETVCEVISQILYQLPIKPNVDMKQFRGRMKALTPERDDDL